MSMNLNAKIGEEVIVLRQTPSQISYMCIIQPDGSIPSILTGNKAKHAMQIYLKWLEYDADGIWENSEDLKIATQNIKKETEDIIERMRNSKKIEVWVS